jgi:hypothetical protein
VEDEGIYLRWWGDEEGVDEVEIEKRVEVTSSYS